MTQPRGRGSSCPAGTAKDKNATVPSIMGKQLAGPPAAGRGDAGAAQRHAGKGETTTSRCDDAGGGVPHPGDNGLFVSTGGFTSDAILEAERSREPVKLLDLDGFIQLLIEHYETLNPEYKAKVPLRKVWVPTE